MNSIRMTSRVKASFKDIDERLCIVQEGSGKSIWLGLSTNRMHLDQKTATELLPLLERFVKTGKLEI